MTKNGVEMERSGRSEEDFSREAHPNRLSVVHRVSVVVTAIIGSIAGSLVIVPLIVVAPDWIFLTLPLLFGALFASSAAHLVSGASVAPLTKVLAFSTTAALICAAFNLALLGAVLTGYVNSVGLMLPGGWPTHLLEAVVVGTVAGIAASRPGAMQRRVRLSFWISLCFSLLAVVILLVIGSAILPSQPFTGA